jgi:hypothetical protein
VQCGGMAYPFVVELDLARRPHCLNQGDCQWRRQGKTGQRQLVREGHGQIDMHYRDMGYWYIIIITVTIQIKVVQPHLLSANQRAVVGERGGVGGEGDVLVWERSRGGVRTYRDWDSRRRVLMSSLFRPLLQLSR